MKADIFFKIHRPKISNFKGGLHNFLMNAFLILNERDMNTWVLPRVSQRSCLTAMFLLPHVSHLPSVVRWYKDELSVACPWMTFLKIFQSMTIHIYYYSILFSIVIADWLKS